MSAGRAPPGATNTSQNPEPGHLGNLSATQQAALNELKEELETEGVFSEERMNDPMLLRFLRARKFDVPKAKDMLLACEQWRKDFDVEAIVSNFDPREKEEVDNYYPQYYHKTDKDGRPIYVEVLGKLDTKALFQITTPERLLQRLVYEYERSMAERLPTASRASGHPVETFCTILDLGGLGLGTFRRIQSYIRQAAQTGQDRYPETMGRFYIVNAPWGFATVWNVVKLWLDPVTVSKIDVLGSEYQAKLLEQIPAENLPKHFGGVCACAGAGCSLSDAGPWNEPAPGPALAAQMGDTGCQE